MWGYLFLLLLPIIYLFVFREKGDKYNIIIIKRGDKILLPSSKNTVWLIPFIDKKLMLPNGDIFIDLNLSDLQTKDKEYLSIDIKIGLKFKANSDQLERAIERFIPFRISELKNVSRDVIETLSRILFLSENSNYILRDQYSIASKIRYDSGYEFEKLGITLVDILITKIEKQKKIISNFNKKRVLSLKDYQKKLLSLCLTRNIQKGVKLKKGRLNFLRLLKDRVNKLL